MQQTEETELFVECPVASVQKVVRGKWSMVILSFYGTKRFVSVRLVVKCPW